MTTDHPKGCPQCGGRIPADAPAGLCPRCVMAMNLAPGTLASGGLPAAVPPPTVQEIAPRFPQLEILECLGRGGMGVVYRARQRELDRIVALKILAPERVTDSHFGDRFQREAKALAKLNHPNIVTLYEFGQSDGLYYFLMEYVDGLSLRRLLERGRLPPEQALAIVPQVCDALQFAHGRGIVHRDIKPENILLDRAGHVKIADFGVARLVGADAPESLATGPAPAATEAGRLVGTPGYAAPEQASQPQSVDHRADIYSLGVVLYEMLTGELPHGRLEPPSRKVQIDVRLDEIVLKALEREPARRYQRADEVRTMVATITGEPARGGQAPATERQRQRSRTRAFLTLAPAIVGVAMAGVLVYGMLRSSHERWSDEAAELASKGVQFMFAPDLAGGGVMRADIGRSVTLSAKDIQRLRSFPRLRAVYITGAALDPGAAEALGDLAQIKGLGLSGQSGSDVALRSVGRLARLEWLGVSGPSVGDEGVGHLRGLRRLTSLSLAHTAVTDAGVDSIADIRSLRTLDLSRTAITDEGLASLARLPALKELSLEGTAVTDAGLATLRHAKPKLRIRSFPSAAATVTPTRESAELQELKARLAQMEKDKKAGPLRELERSLGMAPESLQPVRDVFYKDDRIYALHFHDVGGLTNLAPLAGLELESLFCLGAKIASLEPLRGMPLTSLHVSGKAIDDLSPLRDCPLTTLGISGTSVSDLSPLRGKPLVSLGLFNCPITNVAPLAGMPLESLLLMGTKVTDLSPLAGQSYQSVNLTATPIANLESLRQIEFSELWISSTRVRSLEPLRGKRLTSLFLYRVPVDDLGPLTGMPIRALDLQETEVRDLTILGGLPLERLFFSCDYATNGLETVRALTTLKEIHNEPAADYWRRHDKVMQTMKRIVIPSLEFHQTNAYDVVQYLMRLSVEPDASEQPGEGHAPRGLTALTLGGRFSSAKPVTLSARNITLYDAVNAVCDLAGLRWNLQGESLVFDPWRAAPPSSAPRPGP